MTQPAPSAPSDSAVVLVSGGDTQTPYTTPDAACEQGLPAGMTHTALRKRLLDAGFRVFTAPSMNGPGVARSTGGFGDFADGPPPLPAALTVNSVDAIDLGGEHLAAFVYELYERAGVRSVDLVGHSMGGLFSRSAIRQLRSANGSVTVRSLVTIGSPWRGSFVGDVVLGYEDRSLLAGERVVEAAADQLESARVERPGGLLEQVTMRFLDGSPGAPGWNDEQRGVLDGIPVSAIGGDRCVHPGGDPRAWPNDGLVATASQVADGIGEDVVPQITRHRFPVVHSLTFTGLLGLGDAGAMTWNPAVLDCVVAALPDDSSA